MANFPPVADQLAILTRGVVDVHVAAELEQRLEESRTRGIPLRVKAGFDPTRPDLHLGHAVLLNKMRQFQDLGHQAILLIGEFTAMVGDPTGKSEARPRLTRDDVAAAAKTYTDQAFKVLDRERTEIRSNAEWLDTLSPVAMIELMAKTTVSRMLERNDFAKRFAEARPIYQHEFLYPLLQGYDSVALNNDIELGGADQLFNLLVGRDLMGKYGQRPQIVLTVPLLEGTDATMQNGVVTGAKMSKSSNNYVGLTEPAITMQRKIMQIDDEVIFRYFELLSRRSNEEIAHLRAEKARGKHPKEIKELFAHEIISRFHSAEAAAQASAEFARVYASNEIPAEIAEFDVLTEGDTLWLAKALSSANLVKSTGEGKRLVEQGGVEVDQVRITDGSYQLAKGKRYLLRAGSKNRKFAYVTVRG